MQGSQHRRLPDSPGDPQNSIAGLRASDDPDALCADSATQRARKQRRGSIGRDLPFFLKTVRSSSGDETQETKAYFKLEHMLTDVRLCLDHGQPVGAPFQSAALTREILTAAMGRGLGEADFAALIEVLEGAAGTKL